MAAYDLAIVGAGIVGLGCALAAARTGRRVVVLDRDAQANGASVRNFGFITVTGQQRGDCWRRAMRSREVWAEIAPQAGIAIEQRGFLLVGRRAETVPVIEAFLRTEMGEGCAPLAPAEMRARFPEIIGECALALFSPHELRVESRDAIPKLAAFLAERMGVTFLRETVVRAAAPPRLETSRGPVDADAVIVCAGDDFHTLYPERIAAYGLTRCKLQMLRAVAPPGFALQSPVMTDLSLARYLGYAELPEAAPLRARLAAEQAAHLAHGIHLIAVQSADGSLVIGDSHHYAATPDPFSLEEVDRLILDEYEAVFGHRPLTTERWIGTYASAPDRLMLMDAPEPRVRIAIVTSGTGASTGFAIGEEVVRDLFG
jgi:D-hydroxyproline dehydrogenase subunit beta